MPELPEVETTRRGIAPHITGKKVTRIIIRNKNLRWPIPARLKNELTGQAIKQVSRRGKYLLLETGKGTALLHLGMSGSLCIVNAKVQPSIAGILRVSEPPCRTGFAS